MTIPAAPTVFRRRRACRRCTRIALAAVVVGAGLLISPARALETVLHMVDKQLVEHEGEVLLEDSAGGVFLRSPDGQLHIVPASLVKQRSSDDRTFEWLEAEPLGEQLLSELPPDFRVHHSTHYVVCYNTTAAYAKWCSALLEKLQKAFVTYWKKRGAEVDFPERPLPVLIFADQASYLQHARAELGPGAANVIGYYSMATNRIVMYDLTGAQAVAREYSNRGSMRDISLLLAEPEAEPLVATVVHEATHQISFNCGLQTRFGANPLWMSEGLAMYFETPDLSTSRSWSGIGNVNFQRWDRYLANERENRLLRFEKLVGSDDAFRAPATAVDAYAQAWALNYFLIKWRPKQYAAYLAALAAKPLLKEMEPRERLADFKKHFGDLETLEMEFQRQMARIR